MDLQIIYEDNHLLVVNKPVNMPVQEDPSGDLDLLNYLKEMIKVRDQKPGNVYLGLVHRLDRPVGGVMVFAKTSKAASRLSDQLRRQAIGRTYLAVVHGRPDQKQAKLVDYMYKDRQKNKSFVVEKGYDQAKKAILSYQLLASNARYSLLEVQLKTGRSHQIRVQLANAGYPLFGDQKYGGESAKLGQQIALFANALSLSHPTLKETMTFRAKPSGDEPWHEFSKSSF